MIEIVITKRRDDYHAQIKDHPKLWDCGISQLEAVTNLMITHREAFEE